MMFIKQSESQVTNGWPTIGKHIGLLIDDGLETLKDTLLEYNQAWY